VENWTFLTNHGRSLLCIARDPEARLRDIAATLGITERSAYGMVTDLVDAGYVVKIKEGRRNRYLVQTHLPLPELTTQEQAIGEVLALLTGKNGRRKRERRSGNANRGTGERWAGRERRASTADLHDDRLRGE
jgi:DNA-binding MarR family transcriptional regulator